MITELKIDLDKKSCVSWAPKVKALQGRESIAFAPGLNILWAPNGFGKTTILQSLARMLLCAQGGAQKVTSEALGVAGYRREEGPHGGLVPVHDGAPVMFCDPSEAIGLIGGMAGFDHDFDLEGVGEIMARGSSGQHTYRRLSSALESLMSGNFPDVAMGSGLRGSELAGRVMADLRTGGGRRPTLLLDEPDRSLDVPLQASLWAGLDKAADEKNVQVIASTHATLALGLDAKYIDLDPGYLLESVCVTVERGKGARKRVAELLPERDKREI